MNIKVDDIVRCCIVFVITTISALSVNATPIEVLDDTNRIIKLDGAAKRVISLSPHITELLYSAGATKQVVAAVEYSNYPQVAKLLPRVGSGHQLDIEAIMGLKPDLIIGWKSGNNSSQLERLKQLGFILYLSEPKRLEDIADNLNDFGDMLGTQDIAKNKSALFLSGIEKLKIKYRYEKKVSVFYQVWQQPLFTVNGEHIISHIIELCGGQNIFSDLNSLSPQVDIEAVIVRNPEVIVAGAGETREDWLENWKKWKSIKAVKNKQLYGIDADLIVRHTPRILHGAEMMCEALNKARSL